MSPRGVIKFYASKYSGAAGGLEFKILRVGILNFIRIGILKFQERALYFRYPEYKLQSALR